MRILTIVITVALALWGVTFASASQSVERQITIQARSFAFEPAVIRVNRGDRLTIRLEALDVTHGLYIDGYGVDVAADVGRSTTVSLVASRAGKFRFRCSVACGALHPFMIGELIVRPNAVFPGSVALLLIVTVGMLALIVLRQRSDQGDGPGSGWRYDLLRIPLLCKLYVWRGTQPALMLASLFGFVIVILTGLIGTPVGGKNFSIIFVWIVWWALLMIILVPLAGRLWCLACPIPGLGEWLQRRSIVIKRSGRLLTLGKQWPRRLDNIWLQNVAFLGVAIYSGLILTLPLVTALVLLAFIIIAIGLSLVFERRTFCRYICPVGGFIGLYSLVAPLELRVKDVDVCRVHRGKECYLGGPDAHGCPWMVRPWQLRRNPACGLCGECVRACPKDNVSLNLRPFGADLFVAEGRGLDETFKALIMLTCALLYSAIFLGPWAWMKDWAATLHAGERALYAVAFLAINLAVAPGLFLLATTMTRWWGGLKHISGKQVFRDCSYALVPLGLSAWVAFSFSFVSVSASYAVSVISDPFGWGWNLFGTRDFPWGPVLTDVLPYLQIATLAVGLAFSLHTAQRIISGYGTAARRLIGALLPTAVFMAGVTVALLKLYVG